MASLVESYCDESESVSVKKYHQRLFIIRHGERLDNVDFRWESTAERPYDPPLTSQGVEYAISVARERLVGKEIKYVVSSPFLRCLQTAHQICDVLQLPGIHTCNRIVDVISGCCGIYQDPEVPAMADVVKEGIKIATMDETPLPSYPEKLRPALKRFQPEYNKLANKYWPHNVVIVTHGYGVVQAVTQTDLGRQLFDVYVDYCGHVELSRVDREIQEWTMVRQDGIDFSGATTY